MIIELDEVQGSAWFDFPAGGKVQLKTLDFKDWKAIRKASTRLLPPEFPKLDGKYVRMDGELTDQDTMMEGVWSRSITAWEGLPYRLKGEELPCTDDNKVLLMCMKDSTFRDFYNEKIAVLNAAEVQKKADVEKNSSTGLSSPPTKLNPESPLMTDES